MQHGHHPIGPAQTGLAAAPATGRTTWIGHGEQEQAGSSGALFYLPEADNRKLLSMAVASQGFAPILWADAPEQLALALRAGPISLVIMAHSMAQAVPLLRRDPRSPNHRAQMLVCGESFTPENLKELRNLGVSWVDFLPLTPHKLVARIEQMRKDRRLFYETPNYVGPDRRNKRHASLGYMAKRRTDNTLIVRHKRYP